jgi:hypothetical protein
VSSFPSPDTQGRLRNRDEHHRRTYSPRIWQLKKDSAIGVFPGEEGVSCRAAEPVKRGPVVHDRRMGRAIRAVAAARRRTLRPWTYTVQPTGRAGGPRGVRELVAGARPYPVTGVQSFSRAAMTGVSVTLAGADPHGDEPGSWASVGEVGPARLVVVLLALLVPASDVSCLANRQPRGCLCSNWGHIGRALFRRWRPTGHAPPTTRSEVLMTVPG